MKTLRFQQYLSKALYLVSLFTALETSAVLVRAQEGTTSTGVVNTSTQTTMVVQDENGRYQLFVFDKNTIKPATIPIGSRVRVISSPGDDPLLRVARSVAVLQTASKNPADPQRVQADAAPPAVVPPEIRRLENQIERGASRFQIGARAGLALDPELVLLGVQAHVGPFFKSNIYFRPNVEFGFGEVTALFGINAEVIYRLPLADRRWTPYFGIGPGFNFLHQDFARGPGEGTGTRIDFGDFRYDTGLNILGGVRYRNGMFMELKTSVYSNPAPTLRLMIGYDF